MRLNVADGLDGGEARGFNTTAAAPLLTPGALPAVIVPSLRNAGFSAASASSVVLGRLCSSVSKMVAPLRPGTSIGTISPLNFPAA